LALIVGAFIGAVIRIAPGDFNARLHESHIEIQHVVMGQVLQGLHAAHEARNDLGEPLDLVHRDVSPQNVLVGSDGVARVLDFGCMDGIFTLKLQQLGGEAVGYDISPAAITQAKRFRGPAARPVFTTVPPGPGQFDRIYCQEVIEHVEDDSALVGELVAGQGQGRSKQHAEQAAAQAALADPGWATAPRFRGYRT